MVCPLGIQGQPRWELRRGGGPVASEATLMRRVPSAGCSAPCGSYGRAQAAGALCWAASKEGEKGPETASFPVLGCCSLLIQEGGFRRLCWRSQPADTKAVVDAGEEASGIRIFLS